MAMLAPSTGSDVRSHLPAPLPAGWRIVAIDAPSDRLCKVETPGATIIADLRREPGSDHEKLFVSVSPEPPTAARLGDATVRELLAGFRARGVLEEKRPYALARNPGLRVFVGKAG